MADRMRSPDASWTHLFPPPLLPRVRRAPHGFAARSRGVTAAHVAAFRGARCSSAQTARRNAEAARANRLAEEEAKRARRRAAIANAKAARKENLEQRREACAFQSAFQRAACRTWRSRVQRRVA